MNTVYINIKGGLGNQLFQAAIGIVLEHEANVNVRYIIDGFNGYSYGHLFLLDQIPNLTGRTIPLSEIRDAAVITEPNDGTDKALVMQVIVQAVRTRNLVVDGYWQNEGYFLPHRDAIRTAFQFPVEESLKTLGQTLRNENAIALHVRRHEYGHHGLACVDYYKNCIAEIRKEKGNVPVVIFSDEFNFCEFVFKNVDNARLIRGNAPNPLTDFYLQSHCKHFVIANSSFSWWAAWMGEQEDSIVYAPEPWCVFNANNPISKRWRSVPNAVRAP